MEVIGNCLTCGTDITDDGSDNLSLMCPHGCDETDRQAYTNAFDDLPFHNITITDAQWEAFERSHPYA
jgi:hypothetical protein